MAKLPMSISSSSSVRLVAAAASGSATSAALAAARAAAVPHVRRASSDSFAAEFPTRRRSNNFPPRSPKQQSAGGAPYGPRGTAPGTPFRKMQRDGPAPSILSLADLSVEEITGLIRSSIMYKHLAKDAGPRAVQSLLQGKSVALLFSKRSTRTRVASESATSLLGGNCMFLGRDDIQLGVNESEEDTAKVIGSMVDGIMARVGAHSEVEALAKHSPVPVINALSDLYHPTQILADLLTMYEVYDSKSVHQVSNHSVTKPYQLSASSLVQDIDPFKKLAGKKVVWVGDTNNVLHDMLVTYPRLGMTMAVASPKGYDKVDPRVWAEVERLGCADKITLTNSPAEALQDADIVVTDTWISMGQEQEKADRLTAFAGYQVSEALCADAGAKPDWKFMHCLPRKQEEVDDDVFYGPRSVVFQEAENRKWTTAACFAHLFGQWRI